MLEIKQPGMRLSAYWDGTGDSSGNAKQGQFVKMNGLATAALGPTATAGGPKFAASGDKVVAVAVTADTLTGPVFPTKKYHFKLEDSDLTLDTLTSGEYLVYFKGGQYETDNYGAISAAAAYGHYLFLDASGRLTTTTGGAAIATVIQKAATYDSNYSGAAMLWFEMLDFPVNPLGGSLSITGE